MSALLRRNPDLDAVFVANDPMAIGALEALHSLGRRVPDDVAVIGFDDVIDAARPPAADDRAPAARRDDEGDGRSPAPADRGRGGESEFVVCPTNLIRRASA